MPGWTGILPGMTGFDAKANLRVYLQGARETLVWKLDGLSEYDVEATADARLAPTSSAWSSTRRAGSSSTSVTSSAGRTARPLPWLGEDADGNAGMWAAPDETRDAITSLYRRAWKHADATIAELPLDAPATVPWWGEGEVTLCHILVHMTAEAQRHAGHADIVRELIDGSVGLLRERGNMSPGDPAWWHTYRDQVERAARAAGR